MKKVFLFFLFLFFIFNPLFAFSEVFYPPVPGVQSPSEFIETAETEDILPLFVKYLYSLSLLLSILITGGIVLYASFLYFISFGKPSEMANARGWFTSAAQGALIVFGSYLILFSINPDFTFLRPMELHPPDLEYPEVEFDKETLPVYFQIPMGKVIESAVLSEEAEEKLYNIVFAVNDIKKASDEIYEKSHLLNNLIQSTHCGNSLCDFNCSPEECLGYDGRPETDELIEEEVDISLELMQEKIVSLSEFQGFMLNDIYQIESIATLMSLGYDKVLDYNTLLLIQEYDTIEIDTFLGWEDIFIDYKIEGEVVVRVDPLTFYFNKKGNEDIIYLASTLPGVFYSQVELFKPEEGWSPPPGEIPNVPLHKQTDSRWRNTPYGCGTTIRGAGCGPTALAMLISYYTGHNVFPDEVAALSLKYGHRVCGSGTAGRMLSDDNILGRYGLKGSYRVSPSLRGWEDVLEKLKYGPIIITVGPSIFTGQGHYIVLKGKIGDTIYINDPNKEIYQAPERIVRNAFIAGSGIYGQVMFGN